MKLSDFRISGLVGGYFAWAIGIIFLWLVIAAIGYNVYEKTTREDKPYLFARAGDLVTMENGTPVCTVTQNLYAQTPVKLDFCTDWKIPEPHSGETIAAYNSDGTSWVRASGKLLGMQLFINGRWVP